MIRGVLSDWGHTLFDTAGSVGFISDWATEHGITATGDRIVRLYTDAFARSRSAEELAKGRDKWPEIHRASWFALWHDLEAEVPGISAPLYEFETGPRGWSPFVDTPEFLQTLADRGIPLVIVSDVPFDLRPIFDHYGLRPLVHEFFLSGEHGTVKAEGALFRMALDALGMAPSEVLMVGDNPANDGHAVHQGIRTLLLPLVPSGQPRGLDSVLPLIT